jgi:anti-sigma regulatory factor (Ser/Thr protein kinase)
MGKGTASKIRLETLRRWDDRGGMERTLDPVTESMPAWPTEGGPEWRGFPAAPAYASAVRQMIQAAAIDRMVSPDDTADLILATSEAFANAVRHGDCGPEDAVWISQHWRPDAVTLRLRYRGAPFAVDDAPGLPAPDATSGRGRAIMDRLLDQVEYRFRDGWTEVTLARRLRRAQRTAVPG